MSALSVIPLFWLVYMIDHLHHSWHDAVYYRLLILLGKGGGGGGWAPSAINVQCAEDLHVIVVVPTERGVQLCMYTVSFKSFQS